MEKETRHEKFKRLASKRTTTLLNQLRLLGNLSNKANYEYTEEEIRKIFRAIEEQSKIIKAKFKMGGRREFKL